MILASEGMRRLPRARPAVLGRWELILNTLGRCVKQPRPLRCSPSQQVFRASPRRDSAVATLGLSRQPVRSRFDLLRFEVRCLPRRGADVRGEATENLVRLGTDPSTGRIADQSCQDRRGLPTEIAVRRSALEPDRIQKQPRGAPDNMLSGRRSRERPLNRRGPSVWQCSGSGAACRCSTRTTSCPGHPALARFTGISEETETN